MSFVHKDSEADTVLIERQCPSASTLGLEASHLDSIDTTSRDSTVIYDWQKYQSLQNTSHHEPVQIPADLLQLSDQEIRQQLCEYGYNVGPITVTTRKVYLQRLHRLQTDPEAVEQLAKQTKEPQGKFKDHKI